MRDPNNTVLVESIDKLISNLTSIILPQLSFLGEIAARIFELLLKIVDSHLSLMRETFSGNRVDDCTALLSCIGDTKTSAIELADNQQKAVYSVWWSLVQAFWKRYGPDPIREDKLTEAIKQWCLEVTKDYEEVSVFDFTSSWRDGYAFNCLLHSFDDKLIDLSYVAKSTANERIEYAFSIAEKNFKVARLLTVKGEEKINSSPQFDTVTARLRDKMIY
ncbi:hypothetical protein DICVIV_02719 [Dictyocaulus viviparus]|uniref:Calponin-homology (CH) domain-containing protein n=1 Tax=Dictyocaulus viviparus TaxID=29172 RepID=A0A0D8Y2Q4_DICVI|nr:hypothetical protein DICVIV_02719 [Dictyocaulus viviparus]